VGTPERAPFAERARAWWRRRSRNEKVALTAAVVLLLFAAIGAFGEDPQEAAEPDTTEQTQPDDETATETLAEATDQTTTAPPPAPPPPIVAEVRDGDTILLADGTRVRLLQIDAPEFGQAECYSQRSVQTLRRLLPPGTRVRLAADPALDKRDRFGRQLRYVFRGRRNINLVLVRQGAAAPWYFEGEQGRYADRLTAAAEQAQVASRGLWSACPATELDPFAALATRRPPPPAPPPPPEPLPAPNCHPSYRGACLNPNSSDYDCEGGSGNGPDYTGFVEVIGPDEYGLDRDGDGAGCED
jgi:endonuclease YncB( thermonuclease family)